MSSLSRALLVTGDLFFSSQIVGIARSAGVTIQLESRLPDFPTELECDLLILDLESPALDFDELSELLDTHDLMTLGYGSHIKTQLFAAGKKAGIEHLVTRGQLQDRLQELFR